MSENDTTETDDKKILDAKPADQQDTPPAKQEDPPQDTTVKQEPEDQQKEDPEPWASTGSDIGDDTLRYLQETGVDQAKAKELLFDAVQSGDITAIDKAALAEAVGGDAAANIVLSGIKSYLNDIKTKAAEVTKALHEEVGSEENWKTLTEWARSNLTESELSDYISLVGQGGRKAKMAARDLMQQYEEAGNSSLKNGTIVPKAQKDSSNEAGLSRAEYFEALEKASRLGNLTPQLQQKLYAARERGKKQGK